MGKQWQTIFLGSKFTAVGNCSHEIKRPLLLGRNAMTNLDSLLKSRDITLPTKVRRIYDFSNSYVWMWELDHKEGCVLKNWCFRTVMLEKTHKSPLDCKELKPVNPKGDQPWIFIAMTDAEAEALVLWPPDAKSWLIGKDSDPGQDRRQKEKGTKEDEMVGWYQRLNGHELEQAPGSGEGQGSLACCRRKESNMTERLNNNNQESYSTGSKWSVHLSLTFCPPLYAH